MNSDYDAEHRATPAVDRQLSEPSPAALWTGRVIGILPALLLVVDAGAKLLKPQPVVESTVAMGYSEQVIVPLGVVLLISALLYLYPRTAIFGAILLTGYLGGAVDAHVHHGDSLLNILFPAVFGALLWIGLYLRYPRFRPLVQGHWKSLNR